MWPRNFSDRPGICTKHIVHGELVYQIILISFNANEVTGPARSMTDWSSVTLTFEWQPWVLHETHRPIMVNKYATLFCLPFKHEQDIVWTNPEECMTAHTPIHHKWPLSQAHRKLAWQKVRSVLHVVLFDSMDLWWFWAQVKESHGLHNMFIKWKSKYPGQNT